MPKLSQRAFKKLQKIVGKKNCTNAPEDLVCYAYDATAARFLPEAVIFPETKEQVSRVMALADRERFAVIPRGSGSGMTGGSLAVKGGVVMALVKLNRIIDIDAENMTARVEPGLITGKFQKTVESMGLFYPPDPSSSDFSTIGGNVAECAGGPRAIKYGVTRDYVLGLEAVLPSGKMIRTGVNTTKGVVGYDLTRLLTGSEGTLAVIVEITLRLLPLPEQVRTMTAMFADMKDAAKAVSEIIRRKIIPRALEYMDNASITCVEKGLGLGLPVDADAMLFIQVDGTQTENEAALEKLAAICSEKGAARIRTAETPEDVETLWKARKAISPSLYAIAPDKINEDIVVPRSKIPDMIEKIRSIGKDTGLTIASFGHAGDGNIHVNIMLDKKDESQAKAAKKALDALFDETLRLGGTISGEHGVGITKLPYLSKELGREEIELMKKIKALFDPNGILNPGKIFPETTG